MGIKSKIPAFFLTVTALLLLSPAVESAAQVKIGERMPAITGRNLVGKTVDVDSYYGEGVVILAFWSMYCKPCVAEISSLIELQNRYHNRLKVIGINTDGELPPSRVRAFIERYEQFEGKEINYEIIFDEHNQITRQLKVGFLPTVLAVDTDGLLVNSFVGFEEKDEIEILQGLENLLAAAGKPAQVEEVTDVFAVEITLPVCGFYDERGWRDSFYGGTELEEEMERVSRVARELALKQAMKMALEKLGITLYEREYEEDCLAPYGVRLQEDPWKARDCLTNLLNSLRFREYVGLLEREEVHLETAHYLKQKMSVSVPDLIEDLERVEFSTKPISITFSVINMDEIKRMKFEEGLLSQSRHIGYSGFPTYTVYAGQEVFAEEMEEMDFGDMKVFVEEAGSGVIEVEVWP